MKNENSSPDPWQSPAEVANHPTGRRFPPSIIGSMIVFLFVLSSVAAGVLFFYQSSQQHVIEFDKYRGLPPSEIETEKEYSHESNRQ